MKKYKKNIFHPKKTMKKYFLVEFLTQNISVHNLLSFLHKRKKYTKIFEKIEKKMKKIHFFKKNEFWPDNFFVHVR